MNSTIFLDALQSFFPDPPDIVVTLGSGLMDFVTILQNVSSANAADMIGHPVHAVHGHEAKIYCGTIGAKRVMAFSGRFHIYEGHSFDISALPALAAARYRSSLFIATNAAGGVNPLLSPGDFMLIKDYLILPVAVQGFGSATYRSGLDRQHCDSQPSKQAMNTIIETAAREQLSLKAGTYAYVLGPSYETRAEIRMLRTLGADAVGMSTVPELIAAAQLNVPWIGISCITNKAAGMHSHLSHNDVLHTASLSGSRLSLLLREFIMTYQQQGAAYCPV